jgi:NADPH-dependent F420 reductase
MTKIAIVGGTGKEGRGLAVRWARAGHAVSIGSRDAERARAKADELSAVAGKPIAGGENAAIVREAEVVLVSVPYAGHTETLEGLREALRGKILIDITVPLQPPKVMQVHLPAGQSAALEAQAMLPETRVVASLHHVSSVHLGNPDEKLDDSDTLVVGDDVEARTLVVGLVNDLGLRALDAGVLRNAIALESLTPVMLYLNKKYGGHAGVRFVGLGK